MINDNNENPEFIIGTQGSGKLIGPSIIGSTTEVVVDPSAELFLDSNIQGS